MKRLFCTHSRLYLLLWILWECCKEDQRVACFDEVVDWISFGYLVNEIYIFFLIDFQEQSYHLMVLMQLVEHLENLSVFVSDIVAPFQNIFLLCRAFISSNILDTIIIICFNFSLSDHFPFLVWGKNIIFRSDYLDMFFEVMIDETMWILKKKNIFYLRKLFCQSFVQRFHQILISSTEKNDIFWKRQCFW